MIMIPHKSRKLRCILNLSFCLKIDDKKMPSIKSSTSQTAPQNQMNKWRRVLERSGSLMVSASESSTILLFCKLDTETDFGELVSLKKIAEFFGMYFPKKQTKYSQQGGYYNPAQPSDRMDRITSFLRSLRYCKGSYGDSHQ